MQTRPSIRQLFGPGLLFPLVLIAGCGKGDGPTPIPGTPAPPPPPITCDSINFEDGCGPFNFLDFAGGVASVVRNPEPAGLNTTDKVAQMQKFAGEVFGGSALQLPELINFSRGQAFKMKVWSRRAVPVLFKLEGSDPSSQADDRERTMNHSGSSDWEQLCFDFTGDTAGLTSRAITFIFDLGVNGNAASDPNNWTFFFDDIEQVADCGIPVVALPVNFEGDAADYNFGPDGGFGGGASTVIANPDQSGLNTSAQVARMQKFAGEVFGGSTLSLSRAVDFSQGEAIRMKVWSRRAVPVLFKFEGPDSSSQADDRERSVAHGGGGDWEELCFDFTGDTAGLTSRAITFIFDLGVNGNAGSDPDNWTFYFDEIEQVASCGGGPVPLGPVDFEPDGLGQGFTWNVFENGDNPPVTFPANPDRTGANTSATVARFTARVAGQPFAGTVTKNLPTFTLDSTNSCVKIKVWKTVVSDVGIKFETATGASSGEIKVANTVTNGWEELTFDFSGKIGEPSSTDIAGFVLFPDFATRTQENVVYFDDIRFLAGTACSGGGGGTPTRVDFEGDPAQFDFGPGGGFGGGVSTVIGNPVPGGINTSAQVVQMEKFRDQVFGGSTLALPAGVDWSKGETFTMKVWSRRTVPVRFKLEGLLQERDDTHDGGSQWQELCFDFAGATAGAPVTGISIFFDLGQLGDAANDPANWTFYYDDIQQTTGGCAAPPPPAAFATITFDDPATTYTLTDFGGNLSTVTNDPAGGSNQVAQVVKPVSAELWAGTTVSTLAGNAVPRIPLDAANTRMSVRVYSPNAGIPIRLKIENASDPTVSVETEASTTAVNAWETLVFDFANQVPGTAAFNPASTYTRISIFFNFGTTGAAAGEKTYYFDDVGLAAAPPPPPPSSFTTITFDDPGTTYTLTDFGGNASTVTNDPAGGSNQVAQVVKPVSAELWAGTTVSTLPGNAVPRIPLDAASTRMSVRVYSPDAGIPIRLKIEDASNAAISVETEASTTAANAWQTLVFDFANQVPGTAAFNPASTYTRISIFFNFGTTGAAAGEKTYYFDDVGLAAAPPPPPSSSFATITFDDPATTYTLADFGGNQSVVTSDPSGGANQVARVVKPVGAELWAGTTVSTLPGNAVPRIPLSAGSTRMSVRVFSPDAGIPIRLKIEDASDPTISVETEANTTAANAWQTLVFDFANQAPGTAAFNPASTYTRISIFFNFGTTGATAGEKTYHFDDVAVAP